ncbi:NAD(P)/FAD-dependent oxidoreductase [Streptomyces sp. NPDC048638]|uniref:NAD(P)/FAD-dependent oxidoreductase n=1 Tax=Streptomyces sp. NPDC048638 TaxID=3365580 RepID=UPI0037141D6F
MAVEEIVIVGAGVVGASVAYHLTALGHERVTVLDARDRGALPGSTGLAPGFVGQLSATEELAVLAKDSVATYRELSDPAGRPVFRQVGCLEVATTEERLARAHEDVAHGRRLGIGAEVLDGAAVTALAPALVDGERALGGLHIPSDGAAEPAAPAEALVAAAERAGARFRWRTPVRALERERGRVVGVRTGADGDGLLRAGRVVLATGIWGPVLAAAAGVRLPMVDVHHPYLFTEELPGLDDTPIDAPIVRYPDHAVYTRRHGRRYGVGSYAHPPLPLEPTAGLRGAEHPFRESDFGSAVAEAMALVPAFRQAPLGRRLNGVFALTPDELPPRRPRARRPGPLVRRGELAHPRRRRRPSPGPSPAGCRPTPGGPGPAGAGPLRPVERPEGPRACAGALPGHLRRPLSGR